MIKKLRVTVDGKPYEVTVEMADESANSAPALPAAPAQAPVNIVRSTAPAAAAPDSTPASHAHAGPGEVPSPLAGRVTAIVVTPGQEVKAGDHLLTLEAMKMNTIVSATTAGKVIAITVAVGDAVSEGQALVKVG
jgi:biotin carboxyl carrier protein